MPEPRLHVARDPAVALARAQAEWGGRGDLGVFGYASLIWRPEFVSNERRLAQVHGYHRALEMRSRVNRGTPERPGLVFALLSGGSCHGLAYRIARRRVEHELPRLWAREMPSAVYDARWLPCCSRRCCNRSSGTPCAIACRRCRCTWPCCRRAPGKPAWPGTESS
jgi:hypothetical protein